jgi:integrase
LTSRHRHPSIGGAARSEARTRAAAARAERVPLKEYGKYSRIDGVEMHAILRAALQHALREDLVGRNVAKLVVVAGGDSGEVVPLSVEEARGLLAAAEGTRLYALWAVALAVGLRRGEALGLRWQDADLDKGELRVVQTLQRVDGRLQFVPPKSERSRRRVPLPAVTVAALIEHRGQAEREAASRGECVLPGDVVFTSSIGTPLGPRNANRAFSNLLVVAGLRPTRLHDLRHTCASLLLAQGVSPRVVMETLGHSAIAVTMNTYGHVMPLAQREAADRMNDLFV